ncbi:hypothetical protein WAC87_001569 [Shigella flexneri]|nr:hypothetical protein [Escherichia sp. MOD1-EC7003]EHR8836032.1 hypothetical protein [Escherichia coli]MCH0693757.1 hypothetical protein [Escherichia coli]
MKRNDKILHYGELN